ncbi:hypothetical protein QBC37DRAFT_12125 [Rhypophila decipiens]|uniref:Uncharacterized protein n=1 Tax=Rhypophila decipiens TaxID=261697 RepID=A0AAN7B667_9PEZI|nr:hypothetical protein QBC37DRAFT_12125 [Rhypophila decipiens]
MPSVAPPKQQAPMEAVVDEQRNGTPVGGPAKLITKQPKSEPAPNYDEEVALRGGGMNLGFTCCNGACSFHKRCC